MKKTKKNIVIQFLHPGSQYGLTKKMLKAGIMPWNRGGHHRKFLEANGQIFADGKVEDSEQLRFWGEWEPDSDITPVPCTGLKDYPNCIHKPKLILDPVSGRPLARLASGSPAPQNTDPFVFGKDGFYYSLCQQHRKGGISALNHLNVGDIVLFGSNIREPGKGPYFALDTVFVVADSRPFVPTTAGIDLAGYVSPEYMDIMGFNITGPTSAPSSCGGCVSPALAPSSSCAPTAFRFKCYKGATPNSRIDDMFSFVPCQKVAAGNPLFGRVKLTQALISDISETQTQGYHILKGSSKAIWTQLCDIVKAQGYELGVKFCY